MDILNKIFFEDCMNGLQKIKEHSVDCILVDLPYGQTARNNWDIVLPMNEYIISDKRYVTKEDYFHNLIGKDLSEYERALNYWNKNKRPGLWQHYKRIIKPNGAIILFGNGMFTANLMKSNPEWWRYNLIWKKKTPTGFLNANKMPLRIHEDICIFHQEENIYSFFEHIEHEDICVFYKHLPNYNPQKTQGNKPVHSYTKHTSDGTNYGKTQRKISGGGSTERYPTSVWTFESVWEFKTDKQQEHYHPTQKPLDLIKQILLTYTNPGDVILDHCCGSGTTCIAAIETNRNFIAFENEPIIYRQMQERFTKRYGLKYINCFIESCENMSNKQYT